MLIRGGQRFSFLILFTGVILGSYPAVAIAEVAGRAGQEYGNIPLSFEANHGQSDGQVRFLSQGEGYSLFLTDSGAVLALDGGRRCLHGRPEGNLKRKTCAAGGRAERDVVRMSLADAAGAAIRGEQELPGKVNYLIGSDPAKWKANLPTYERVRYSGVYPGVDLVYYGNRRQLEYDFVVAPGANAGAIRLQFAGEKRLRIDANGDLILQGRHGSASFHRPVVYQEKEGRREVVAGSFQLARNHEVSFKLGEYDHGRPLVIDPILVYSTYLGGGTGLSLYPSYYDDQGQGIAVDADGSAYVVGTAYSSDFPVTSGAYQKHNLATEASHGSTVFVSKFNAAGTALVYSTFIGGTGKNIPNLYTLAGDFGNAIALDANKNAYITGMTYSTDFPVTAGAFQPTNLSSGANVTCNAFVTKLNATGSALVYSSYLGGTNTYTQIGLVPGDVGTSIAVDLSGNAYVTGYTPAHDFPVTTGAYQTVNHAVVEQATNTFVTKVNPAGTALVYSTYLGGNGNSNQSYQDQSSIAVDKNGNAFVAGNTTALDFPTTAGVLFPRSRNASTTGFVSKLNAAGSALLYSTYLGGSNFDVVNGLAIDKSGNAYVTGGTDSTDFPVTPGAPYPPWYYGGFLTKLNAIGSRLVYSTFLAPYYTYGTAVTVDGQGNAYVAGSTPLDFPRSPNAIGTFPAYDPQVGYSKGFLAKMNASGKAYQYATLLGGSGQEMDIVRAVAVDSSGSVYVTGGTFSSDFPITSGAFQQRNKGADIGSSSGFVSKLDLSGETTDHFSATVSYGSSEPRIFAGTPLTLTVTVTSPLGAPVATGNVTIKGLGTSDLVLSLDSSGMAKWTSTTVPPGQYVTTATYGGDSSHFLIQSPEKVFITVLGAPSVIKFQNSSNIGVYGQGITLRALVTDSGGNPSIGTVVTFASPGLQLTTSTATTNVQGVASVNGVFQVVGTLQASASIVNSPTPATVQLQSLPATLTISFTPYIRNYGAANPTFTFSKAGLVGSDTVNVTATTTALPSSAPGDYPVTVQVTGAATAKYVVSVPRPFLHVRQAPLELIANSLVTTYGQTPAQPTAYSFTGFANGDTANMVAGSPTLSTNVTSTTPVGYYNLQVGLGTLSAANYYIEVFAHPGVVHVSKAPLVVKANDLTMHQGGPVPTLTYSLSGFVNGEQAVGTVTGAAVLQTAVTTHTTPGVYPIVISMGSLTANNYYFSAVAGTLTVLP